MFLSHPNKELKIHLKEVYNNIIKHGNLNNNIVSEAEIKTMAMIVAYGHDFGKYNYHFQNYMKAIKNNVEYKGNPLDKAHQLISAMFVLYLGDMLLSDNKLALLCASCVASHHGSIKNIELLTSEYKDLSYLKYINDLRDYILKDKDAIVSEYKDLGLNEEIVSGFFNVDISKLMQKYHKIQVRQINKNKDINLYLIHQLLYSCLVEGDKMSASDTIIPKLNHISYNDYVSAKSMKYKDSNNYRTKINEEVIENLKNNTSGSIFTITSPTGSGKTTTGVEAAILLREKYNMDKIFYVLPFTSIINQSYKDLSENYYKGKDSSYLMKYHSLSNDCYVINKDKKELESKESNDIYSYSESDYNYNQVDLIMSGLHSGFTITTFNQLVESIISNKNSMLRKFNNFNNSIILIDEIQTLPLKYLKVIESILEYMVKLLNVKIIIMTATKPYVFKDSSIELLKNYEQYFKMQNRTELQFLNNLNGIYIDKLIEDVIETSSDNLSTMIICNTIKTSLAVYEKVYNTGNWDKDDIYYLSTNIIPKDRQIIIDKIKNELKAGKRLILVCTQLVEAGVDIDFNMVYRDIAPLPSIIQSAGRCNREANRNFVGIVKVFNLLDERNDKSWSSYIYDYNSDIEPTKKCLKHFSDNFTYSIPEGKYLKLIEMFYNEMLFYYGEHQNSKDLIKDIIELNFGEESRISKFSLIEQNGYIDVFIPLGDDGLNILNKYLNGFNIEDIAKRKEYFWHLKPDVQSYIISIPPKELVGKISYIENIGNFLYLNEEGVELLYDIKMGFRRSYKKRL